VGHPVWPPQDVFWRRANASIAAKIVHRVLTWRPDALQIKNTHRRQSLRLVRQKHVSVSAGCNYSNSNPDSQDDGWSAGRKNQRIAYRYSSKSWCVSPKLRVCSFNELRRLSQIDSFFRGVNASISTKAKTRERSFGAVVQRIVTTARVDRVCGRKIAG